jgi:hypothetical protein
VLNGRHTLTESRDQVREDRLDRVFTAPPHFESEFEGICQSASFSERAIEASTAPKELTDDYRNDGGIEEA